MFKDKKLRGILFGVTAELKSNLKNRVQAINFPSLNGEPDRRYEWGRDDGFFLALIRQIEKLDKRVTELEDKKKK